MGRINAIIASEMSSEALSDLLYDYVESSISVFELVFRVYLDHEDLIPLFVDKMTSDPELYDELVIDFSTDEISVVRFMGSPQGRDILERVFGKKPELVNIYFPELAKGIKNDVYDVDPGLLVRSLNSFGIKYRENENYIEASLEALYAYPRVFMKDFNYILNLIKHERGPEIVFPFLYPVRLSTSFYGAIADTIFNDPVLTEKYMDIMVKKTFPSITEDFSRLEKKYKLVEDYLKITNTRVLTIHALEEKKFWASPSTLNKMDQDLIIEVYKTSQKARDKFLEVMLEWKRPAVLTDYPKKLKEFFFKKEILVPVLSAIINKHPDSLRQLYRGFPDDIVLDLIKKNWEQFTKVSIENNFGFLDRFSDNVIAYLSKHSGYMKLLKENVTDQDTLSYLPSSLAVLIEKGLFDSPFHDGFEKKNESYPDHLKPSIYNLKRFIDKSGRDFVSIETLKSEGFFGIPEIKELYTKHQKGNKLFLKDIKIPEKTAIEIADLKGLVMSKGKTKHLVWNHHQQKLFSPTNHILLWSVPEELVPESIIIETIQDPKLRDSMKEAPDQDIIEDKKRMGVESHPALTGHFTIGWVRYTLLKDVTKDSKDKRIWVDEIQTDFSTLFGRDRAKEMYPINDLMVSLGKKFIKFIRSMGYEEIYWPNETMAMYSYDRTGQIYKPAYSTIPKKLRFKKDIITGVHQEVDDREVWVLAKKKCPGYTFDI
jgi:hypothetical protein